MNTYILRGVDATLRQRLTNAGVVFYDWNSDIIVEEPQFTLALEALNATGAQKATEHEGMIEVTLKYGAKAQQPLEAAPLPQADEAYLKARKAYIKASSARLKDTIDRAQALLKSKREALLPLQNRVFAVARQVHVTSEQVDENALRRRYADEYLRMRQLPHVTGVRVTKDLLMVYTDTIHATVAGGGERHELGQFMFMVRVDGHGDQPFRMYNLTRRVHGIRESMNAPYVLSDGTGLVAEVQETLIELIAQFEFATAVELAIQFLETVNEDDPARFISSWPVEHRVQTGENK